MKSYPNISKPFLIKFSPYFLFNQEEIPSKQNLYVFPMLAAIISVLKYITSFNMNKLSIQLS